MLYAKPCGEGGPESVGDIGIVCTTRSRIPHAAHAVVEDLVLSTRLSGDRPKGGRCFILLSRRSMKTCIGFDFAELVRDPRVGVS